MPAYLHVPWSVVTRLIAVEPLEGSQVPLLDLALELVAGSVGLGHLAVAAAAGLQQVELAAVAADYSLLVLALTQIHSEKALRCRWMGWMMPAAQSRYLAAAAAAPAVVQLPPLHDATIPRM